MGKITANPSFTTEDGAGNSNQIVDVNLDELNVEEPAEEVSEAEEPKDVEQSEDDEILPEKQEIPAEVQAEVLKIGDREYSQEELQQIVEKGTKVTEWEKKMPGFNVDTFMPDYTRKSQQLAEFQKRMAPKNEPKESLEELGIDQEQIKTFEKVARHLGFVRQTDLIKDSVDAQKEAFLVRHNEYAPQAVGSDERWTQLMEEFSIYNWEKNPHRVEQFLEEAHAKISGKWQESNRGEKMKQNITTKKVQASMASLGGGSAKASAPAPMKNDSAIAQKYRNLGWSEEDIKEILT